jgi:putative transposase
VYLAVIIDLFSRQVVGWSMQPHMKAELVTDALRMACRERQAAWPVSDNYFGRSTG